MSRFETQLSLDSARLPMQPSFKFAIVSDLHVALPETVWDSPNRFHLVEVSIPALEQILAHLATLDLDFLLLPGDLTQHGEPENHTWLIQRLKALPFPTYVVPGNHDVPTRWGSDRSIGLSDFSQYYQAFGYENPEQPYYSCQPVPGVRLIGLNSNFFDPDGNQIEMGRLDPLQMEWLQDTLAAVQDELVLVMLHHNVIEHLPRQTQHPLGRRYMLDNAPALLDILDAAQVQLIFTGHLHVQDVARHRNIYEITTGSLVSYPHPYRVLTFRTGAQGQTCLEIESMRVKAVPDWPKLPQTSREWMGDRSLPFMLKLLTQPPLCLPMPEATTLAADLRYFWAEVANGDALFDFSHFPPPARRYFEAFSAIDADGYPHLIDNTITLMLSGTQA